MSGWAQLLAITGLSLALVSGVGAAAQAQGSDPFAAARKLSDAGKHTGAVADLSQALNSGTLSPENTARGFFLRGVSLAKSGKNPQAISDLTNALWLSGLSAGERSEAYRMRAAAYKASGLARKAAADLKRAKSGGGASAVKVASVTAEKPKVQQALKSNPAGTAGAWTASTAGASQTTAAATKIVEKPKPAPGSGSAVSNFFSNLFTGGSSTPPAQVEQPVRTAAVKQAAAAAKSTAADTAISSWSSSVDAAPEAVKRPVVKPVKTQQVATANWNTNTAAAPTPKVTKPRAVAKKTIVKKTTPKTAKRKGRYNVQVATVRDRATAEKIRGDVAKQAPKALGGLKPSIDTAVLGNMGTFFRVRVDGLQSRQASTSLCRTLSKKGHDCFLLAR